MSRRDDPQSVAEALTRAGDHARRAGAELARAGAALLDALALAATERPARRDPLFAPAAKLLDDLEQALAPDEVGEAILAQVIAALAEEIERWEERAGDDAEARAVLRMLLGLRELLWEVGIRSDGSASAASRVDTAPTRGRRRRASHA